MPTDFDAAVVEQDGFTVEFSNRGTKPKRIYFRCRNPKTNRVKCAVEGCEEMTKLMCGVCKAHRKDHEYMVHSVDWIARIIPPGGTREGFLTNAPSFADLTESLCSWASGSAEDMEKLTDFFDTCMAKIPGEVPDATSLQDAYENGTEDFLRPQDIVSMTESIVDYHFPLGEFRSILTGNTRLIRNVDANIPLRLTAALLCLAYVCEESNRGDLWHRKRTNEPNRAGYAGCYMAAGYFLYRRYTHASQSQVRMCLKG